MKIILILVLIVLCVIVGYGISCGYKQKKKFYESYLSFLQNLKIDIGFSANKLSEIINEYKKETENKDFVCLLDNYMLCLNANQNLTKEIMFKNINFLNEQEKEEILVFFKMLGRSDIFNQVEVIKNKSEQVNSTCEKLKKDCEKYCPLFVKLGLLLGLFLALLMI